MDLRSKFDEIRAKKTGTEKVRIVAFGSSNTERFIPGQHWFDTFELAIKNHYESRIHHCINTGIGGESTRELLGRFDTDAAFYKPDVTFVTIGGNDANPCKEMELPEYEDNLRTIQQKLSDLGSFAVFQTYYAPIKVDSDPGHYAKFQSFMETVRTVAADTDSGLVDHFALWEPFCVANVDTHRELMKDGWHVNETGNQVLGLYIAHRFGIDALEKGEPEYYAKAMSYLKMMGE